MEPRSTNIFTNRSSCSGCRSDRFLKRLTEFVSHSLVCIVIELRVSGVSCREDTSPACNALDNSVLVTLARRVHLFPFRTEPLSFSAPMVPRFAGESRTSPRQYYSTRALQGCSSATRLHSIVLRAGLPIPNRAVKLAHADGTSLCRGESRSMPGTVRSIKKLSLYGSFFFSGKGGCFPDICILLALVFKGRAIRTDF